MSKVSEAKAVKYINTFFMPLYIGALFYISRTCGLKYLLIPPIAAITFLLFNEPFGPKANIRHIVIFPFFCSIVGILADRIMGANAFSIIISCFIIAAVMYSFGIFTPPGLAINVLALLLNIKSWTYPAGVLISTSFLMLFLFIFKKIWLKGEDSADN